jgi:hypothetical protein
LEQAPIVGRLEPLEQASLVGMFKAMAGLNPQIKRKILSIIPDDSTGFEDPKVDSGSHEAKY